jgi:hypothetical protein
MPIRIAQGPAGSHDIPPVGKGIFLNEEKT